MPHLLSTRAGLLFLFALGVSFMLSSTHEAQAGGMSIAAPAAIEQAQAKKALLIDIRTPDEWQQSGMPNNAVGIVWGDAQFADKVLALTKNNKAAALILLCRSGNRSTQAMHYLMGQGFTNVNHVGEGMIGGKDGPGWLARRLPLTPPTAQMIR